MNFALHPWLGEARLVLRRRPGPAVLSVVLLLLFGWLLVSSEYVLQALAVQPLLTACLMALLSFVLAKNRFSALTEYWRYGWWGAAPIDAWLGTRTIVAIALMAMALMSSVLVFWWWSLPWLVVDCHSMQLALAALFAGALSGLLLATGVVLASKNSGVEGAERQRSHKPLFVVGWLQDARLPYLLDWQRRLVLERWRVGRQFWWLAVLFIAIPDGVSFSQVFGLTLMVLSALWLTGVLTATTTVGEEAFRLLASQALPARTLCFGLLRYVLFAGLCSLLFAIAGAYALTSWAAMPMWLVIVLLASSGSLWRFVALLIHQR